MISAINSASFSLQMWAALFKGASLVLYSGTQPATPETAVTGGNLTLATFQFSTSAPFSSVSNVSGNDVVSATFVANTVTPSNNGTITFGRAYMFLVSSNGGAWTTSTAYTVGDIVTSNSSYWVCLVAGTAGASAPTGSSVLAYNDGGAVWGCVGPTSRGTAIADFSVGTVNGQADVILSSTTTATTTNITCTQFQFVMAAS